MMGIGELLFCTAILSFGKYALNQNLDTLRALAFVAVVFGNQATMYTNRERRHLWSSWPSCWVILSSAVDVLIAMTLSVAGIGMSPLPASLVLGTLGGAALFAALLDLVKFPVFRRLNIN